MMRAFDIIQHQCQMALNGVELDTLVITLVKVSKLNSTDKYQKETNYTFFVLQP